MKHSELKRLLARNEVGIVRVVPIPMRSGWCIDVLLKEIFAAGSKTETLESDRSTRARRKLRRFASIDSAAQYLKSVGVMAFRVEMDSAIGIGQFDQKKDVTSRNTEAVSEQNRPNTVSPALNDAVLVG